MRALRSINELTLQIYDAAADPQLWPHTLERLRGELNAAGSALIDYDFASQGCRVVASAGTALDFLDLYQQGLARQVPWIRDGPWYAAGRVSHGHEIVSEDELARSAIYEKWLKPNGFFHRLCGVVRRRGKRVLFVVASRPASSGRYDEPETRFLRELLPHLRRAVGLNQTLAQSQASAALFEHLPYAVFIVDAAGRPVLMNTAADSLLMGSDLRLDREGRLSVGNAAVTDQLQRAVAGVAAGAPQASCTLMAANPADRDATRLVTVAPLGPRAKEAVAGEGAVLVAAVPQQAAAWQRGMLRQAYGLTPAEERLALLILQGLRLDEAEAVLDIRHSTARTHMRRIYAKTGTQRQVELVRLLMSAQSPLGRASVDRDEAS